MIQYTSGSLFDAQTDAIVNPVNCVGIAGKGLALEFKKRYPEWFYQYRENCKEGCIKPGMVCVSSYYFLPEDEESTKKTFIIDFPTKDHW